MAHDAPPRTDPFSGEVRFKVPLPILIPLIAIAVIGAVTIGFSRVMLAIPPEAAVAVALVTAVNILIACGVIAGSKRLEQTSLVELSVIVLYPVLIGVVIALLGIGEGAGHGAESGAEQPSGEAPATGAVVEAGGTLVAEDFEFASDRIALVAGEESDLTLENADTAAHNVYIYETEADADDLTSNTLFEGDDVGANATTTYTIPALEAGEYPFLCRIHPTMRGTVTVE